MLNKCMIIGYLGRDPEMRYTTNGTAVTTFSVATSRKWSGTDGEKREETEWFSVVTWQRLAETCAQYLTKGRQVYVEGRMQTRSWDKDGEKHYRTELVAEEVRFLGGGNDRADGARYDGREPAARGGGFAPGMAVGADSDGDIDPDELPF